MIHITDAAYEGRLCRVEALEGFDRDGSRSIGERSKNVPDPDGLALILAAAGGQVEVVVQKCEDISRTFNSQQGFVPLVHAVHGGTSGLAFFSRE